MSNEGMLARDRHRQALLDELRQLHRAEPAPAELRQRLLERAQPGASVPGALRRALGASPLAARAGLLARRVPLRFALGALALLAVGVALRSEWLRSASSGGLGGEASVASPPEVALGPEPRGAPPRTGPALSPGVPGDARESEAPGEPPVREPVRLLDGKPVAPCPLAAMPRGAVRMPQHSGLPGFSAHTFEQTMPSCGPITRRYLELVPPGLARRTSAPVVILLHDAGEAAETMHARRSRLNFEVIAQRNDIVLIYANAAPGLATSVGVADSGAWQTDRRTHREIDDDDYLQRLVADLGARDVISGDNDIFLVGHGDGAAMALDAAVRKEGLYTGVAAFAPSNLAFFDPMVQRASPRLSRVMIVVDVPSRGTTEAWRLSMPMFARRWAAVLGLEQKVVGRIRNFGDPKHPTGSLQQYDVSLPATGSSGVRLYELDGVVETPPSALHAWDYLTGVDGGDAEAPADLPDLPFFPIVPDGLSVLPEDAEAAAGEPSVVLDDDVVRVPPPDPPPAIRPLPF